MDRILIELFYSKCQLLSLLEDLQRQFDSTRNMSPTVIEAKDINQPTNLYIASPTLSHHATTTCVQYDKNVLKEYVQCGTGSATIECPRVLRVTVLAAKLTLYA